MINTKQPSSITDQSETHSKILFLFFPIVLQISIEYGGDTASYDMDKRDFARF